MRARCRSTSLGCFLLLATGCAGRAGVKTAPSAPPSTHSLQALRWVRTSAEYRALALQVYRAATRCITEAAASRGPEGWAVILDADETVLDNSAYNLERGRAGLGFEEASWAEFVRRRVSTAVPGARAFLEAVKAGGGVVAIVTNRREALCEDTRENLRAERLPFDIVLCRPENAASAKGPRFERVATGEVLSDPRPLSVVAYLGDNVLDFPEGAQSWRDEPEGALGAFGTRYFVLPNPVYGSWEKNPDR